MSILFKLIEKKTKKTEMIQKINNNKISKIKNNKNIWMKKKIINIKKVHKMNQIPKKKFIMIRIIKTLNQVMINKKL